MTAKLLGVLLSTLPELKRDQRCWHYNVTVILRDVTFLAWYHLLLRHETIFPTALNRSNDRRAAQDMSLTDRSFYAYRTQLPGY